MKYYNPQTQQVEEVGIPEYNPELIKNKTLMPETTPTGYMANPQNNPTITPITSESLKPVLPTDLPSPPASPNYAGILESNAAILKAINDVNAIKTTTSEPDWLSKFMSSYGENPPSSLETQYGQAEKAVGYDTRNQAVVESQKKFDALNAQLQGITAKSQAQNLQLEKQISGGGTLTAGSADFLNKQQQEVNRQAAIESLPVQVQILMAQAELTANQNYLKLAQDKLDTLFKLKSEDVTNTYNYNKDLRDKVWEYATAKEKERLAALQKEDDRKFTLLQNNLNYAQQLSRDALSVGQAELAAQITALDPNSKTYTQDLAKVAGQIKQKEDLQYVSGTENQPAGYFDKATGKFTPIAGGGDNIGIDNTLNGEYGDIIKSAANLVGATRGKTSQKSIAQSIANQDWTSAYAQVANNVEESLTGTSKSKFADTRTDYSVMLGLKNAVQSYANSGGDMGLLTGKEEDIKRKLGIDSGKASALAVQLWREFQTYRVNMTGAAFSEAESRDYAAVNPTLGKSLNLNLSIIEGALNQMENRITSTINTRVPNAKKLYDKVQGKITQLDPATAPIGSTIEIDGKKYIKLEEDKFEEQIYSFNPTGK